MKQVWSRTKACRILSRECTGHSKHPLPTTQAMTLHMDITRWSILKSGWYCITADGSLLPSDCSTVSDFDFGLNAESCSPVSAVAFQGPEGTWTR